MADENLKMIFAGLDKAGKTTIYKATMEEMDVNEIKDLRPTRGIERHSHDFLDTDFKVWDLGGQLSYRQTYLAKPEVFNQTQALIFVVDIQDMDRLEEAYNYYADILNILVNVETKPKLYVLFHKFDPELRGKLRNNFYKATRLFRKADSILNMQFTGYATSIYSNGIELAIKRILFQNFEQFKDKPTGSVKIESKSSLKVDVQDDSKPPVPGGAATPAPAVRPAPTAEDKIMSPEEKVAPAPEREEPKLEVKITPPTEEPLAPAPEKEAPEAEVKVTPPAKEKVEAKPEVVDEIVVKTDEELLKAALPTHFDDVGDEVVERLTAVINKRMKDTPEIVALSILSSEGTQVLGIGKTEIDYNRLEKLRSVVSALNPKRFFKDLADIEYRGLGHFPMDEFDIYFARGSEGYAIAVLATDVSTLMLQNAQRIVKSIRQGLSLTGDDDTEDDEDAPKTKKKDLVSDLRNRLKNLSGLGDLN